LKSLPEDLYVELLCFITVNWKERPTQLQNVILLKYMTSSGNIGLKVYQMLQNASAQVWQVYQMLQIASEYIFRHSGGRYGGPQKGLECSEVTPNMWSL
jgi:hypothetical protein